jgi:thiamine-phosphate pyrophosphorylase
MAFSFPRVYPILDSSQVPQTDRATFLASLGRSLVDADVTLLEYRNKLGSDAELTADAEVLRRALPDAKLVLDDRADLVIQIGFDGVHVDAGDISAADARRLLGPDRIVGTFAGSDSLIPGILTQPADYFAIGPVFATSTKQTNTKPIGIEGVRKLRQQVGPNVVLTAAAGITPETAPLVIESGATSVAVSAAIFRAADPAKEFRRWRERLG